MFFFAAFFPLQSQKFDAAKKDNRFIHLSLLE